jgi:diaminopropionate ammonia-lyase
MLEEADTQIREQTGGAAVTHAIVPVGVGSVAQAVTQHFKRSGRAASPVTVMAVEPESASSLKSSLEAGTMTTVPTEDTIMCGMNCGTVSTTAWPSLKAGIDAAILVTDTEAHQAVHDLDALEIHAGPCGAAALAALRRAVEEGSEELGFNESSAVVLFCTEGARDYEKPGAS